MGIEGIEVFYHYTILNRHYNVKLLLKNGLYITEELISWDKSLTFSLGVVLVALVSLMN